MSALVTTPAPLGLGAVNEAVGYARTASPSTPVPDLGSERWHWRVNMHLHGVALDVLYAAMAFNDDLPWGSVQHRRREEYGYAYSYVTVELPHACLTLFSEYSPLDDVTATANPSAGK
jgi:hypothetical protein